MIKWKDSKTFEINGCDFTIDITPGYNRRESKPNDFTIVKTKDFVDIYEDINPEKIDKVLELGIFQGGSLVFMDRLFNPSKIVGVDLSKQKIGALEVYKKSRKAVQTYYGVSQDDELNINQILKEEFNNSVDLVVDDASHLYEQTKKSFEIIFPYVSHGGLYIIEDWAWSFKDVYQSKENDWYSRAAMANLIFELVGDIASNRAIANISVHNSMVIVEKSKIPNTAKVFQIKNHRGRKISLL